MYSDDLQAWAAKPFVDVHERHEAMRNPLYQSSEGFRQAVAAKLSITSDEIAPQVRTNPGPQFVYGGSTHPNDGSVVEAGLPSDAFAGPSETDLQAFADEQDHAADHPMALDYRSLKIEPRSSRKPQGPVEVQLSPEQQQAIAEQVGKAASSVLNAGNNGAA